MTVHEFLVGYASRAKVTPRQLLEAGRYPTPCECGDVICQGWQMARVTILEDETGQIVSLPDHDAEVARLRGENEQLQSQLQALRTALGEMVRLAEPRWCDEEACQCPTSLALIAAGKLLALSGAPPQETREPGMQDARETRDDEKPRHPSDGQPYFPTHQPERAVAMVIYFGLLAAAVGVWWYAARLTWW